MIRVNWPKEQQTQQQAQRTTTKTTTTTNKPTADPDFDASTALVAFLRAEANAAEQRANGLRAQADHYANLYDIPLELQRRYGM